MSILRRAVTELRDFTQFSLKQNFWGDWGGNYETWSGVTVSQATAMTCSAVYAAVSLISDTIATLPVEVVQRYGDGSRYTRQKPDWMLNPNPTTRLTWSGFVQQVLTSLLLDGNAFIGVARKPGSLEPFSLWPLEPTAVTVDQDQKTGVLSYRVGGRAVDPRDLVHMRALTMPGQPRGLSPIDRARQSIGRTLSAERFASRYFDSMAMPGVVISTDANLTEQKAKDLADYFDSRHRGSDKAFRTTVLGGGAKVDTLTLTPEQVQMLETMKAGVLDVARWYRIPPYMLDPSVSSTWGTGIAEQNIQTKQYTLGPWATRLQEGLSGLVYDTFLDTAFTVRFDFRGFLKADPEKQAKYLETKMRCKALTPDEWRALDDENPMPNGAGAQPLNSVQWQP